MHAFAFRSLVLSSCLLQRNIVSGNSWVSDYRLEHARVTQQKREEQAQRSAAIKKVMVPWQRNIGTQCLATAALMVSNRSYVTSNREIWLPVAIGTWLYMDTSGDTTYAQWRCC